MTYCTFLSWVYSDISGLFRNISLIFIHRLWHSLVFAQLNCDFSDILGIRIHREIKKEFQKPLEELKNTHSTN